MMCASSACVHEPTKGGALGWLQDAQQAGKAAFGSILERHAKAERIKSVANLVGAA